MKKHLLIAASAILAMASCTTSDDVFEGADFAEQAAQENVIQFGTFLGQSAQTRAGGTGSINTHVLRGFDKAGTPSSWSEANAKAYGFGVFAYYTGNQTYNDYAYSSVTLPSPIAYHKGGDKAPNFMYNEQVWYNNGAAAGSVTNWTYALTKYWPNEVTGTAVDDQENDKGDDPATTNYTYGGNLSFFAYAPYVSSVPSGEKYGITKISANNVESDPIISYAVNPEGKDVVDLLWGTMGATSSNVLGAGNTGVAYSNVGTATKYEQSILPHYTNVGKTASNGYRLNADLTKQKTNGTVNFAFKHALAKVGGSEEYSQLTDGSGNNVTHGLMVDLLLDDGKGNEFGGTKQDETKVTIVDVRIAARSLVANGGNFPGESGYTRNYLKGIAAGNLNLATGYWEITSEETTTVPEAATTYHNITSDASVATLKDAKAATLNTDIAEPATWNATWDSNTMKGVEVDKKNVYATETAPLVFIPGTYPELTIVIDYIVRTKDEKLAQGYSYVRQEIAKRVTFTNAVELNKQYNLLMHLGLTSVKFDATVSDWEVNGDTNGDGIINPGPTPAAETLIVEDAYLPRNVGEVTVKVATGEDKTETINVAAGTQSVTVQFTGLTSGQAYKLTSSLLEGDKLSETNGDHTTTAATQDITLTMKPNTESSAKTHTFEFTYNSKKVTVNIVQAAPGEAADAATKAANAAIDFVKNKYTDSTPGSNAYQPKGTFAANDANPTYEITEGDAMTVIDGIATITADIARFLGALWRFDYGATVTTLTYNDEEYVWKGTLKGSNWVKKADSTVTLVKVLSDEFTTTLSGMTADVEENLVLYLNGQTDTKHKITLKVKVKKS